MDHDLIDQCTAYLESKDAHYLAKEGYAVFYSSSTGRKSDYTWHRVTVPEMLRMIKAMRLTPKQSVALKDHHLISAFQELGRVYEYAVKTRHSVGSHIFNYMEHSEGNLADEAMNNLSVEITSRGYKAVLLVEVLNLFMKIQDRLDIDIKLPEARDLMCKHFETLGFEVRAGSRRPVVNGRKTPALMMEGSLPSHIHSFGESEQKLIEHKVYGDLK